MSEGPITIEFLGEPSGYPSWSTNNDRSMNWPERDRIKRNWFDGARFAGMQWKVHNRIRGFLPYTVVQLEFYTKGAKLTDPHNYCGTILKASIDGLVAAHFWPNDRAEHVGHRESLIRAGTPFLPRLHLYVATRPWEKE
jgi:hypothetical protein